MSQAVVNMPAVVTKVTKKRCRFGTAHTKAKEDALCTIMSVIWNVRWLQNGVWSPPKLVCEAARTCTPNATKDACSTPTRIICHDYKGMEAANVEDSQLADWVRWFVIRCS